MPTLGKKHLRRAIDSALRAKIKPVLYPDGAQAIVAVSAAISDIQDQVIVRAPDWDEPIAPWGHRLRHMASTEQSHYSLLVWLDDDNVLHDNPLGTLSEFSEEEAYLFTVKAPPQLGNCFPVGEPGAGNLDGLGIVVPGALAAKIPWPHCDNGNSVTTYAGDWEYFKALIAAGVKINRIDHFIGQLNPTWNLP